MIGYLPLGAILALLWAWRSHTKWPELGFVRPKSWIRTAAAGIAFGVALKLLMKALVMPLLGADCLTTRVKGSPARNKD